MVGGAILLARGSFVAMLRLDPIDGSNSVFANVAAMFVALFGYAYLRVAIDPTKFRPYILLGAAGKLLAVACVVVPWWQGAAPVTLPLLVAADFLFALLFLDFLRRTA